MSKDEGKLADVIVRRGGQDEEEEAKAPANRRLRNTEPNGITSRLCGFRFLIMKGDVTA